MDHAKTVLRELDTKMAVDHGVVDAAVLKQDLDSLELDQGIALYLDHVKRPRVMKGASARTAKRYKAVFDRFKEYGAIRRFRYWQQVNRTVFEGFGRWLEEEEYAPRGMYLMLTTVKQAIKWLIAEKHLPESCRFAFPLVKCRGTDTYCYRDGEVASIIAKCYSQEQLHWLGDVVTALAYTGLRISEVAQLRWEAVTDKMLRVIDNSGSTRHTTGNQTVTKTHESRSLPIHPELQKVLEQRERRRDGRVFHGPRGGTLKPDVVRTVLLRDVLKPLAKELPHHPGQRNLLEGRVHSFRHFFCSKCAQEGVPEQTLMNWLGHRDSAMIRHYYHLHDDQAQHQMSKIKPIKASDAA